MAGEKFRVIQATRVTVSAAVICFRWLNSANDKYARALSAPVRAGFCFDGCAHGFWQTRNITDVGRLQGSSLAVVRTPKASPWGLFRHARLRWRTGSGDPGKSDRELAADDAGDALEHAGPVAGCCLSEEAHGRVPGAMIAIDEPAPLGDRR
jgi:hypothetical protein